MLASAEGQIVACNIVAGLDHNLFAFQLARDALESLRRLIQHSPDYDDPAAIADGLRHLRDGHYPPAMRVAPLPPELRLRAPQYQHTTAPSISTVSCVLPASQLNDFIAPDHLLTFRSEGLTFPPSASALMGLTMTRRWRSLSPTRRRVPFNPTASLGRSVLWLTRHAPLQSHCAGRRANPAQRARDVLGLVHHGADTVLAALHFSAAVLGSRAAARPTFADAADHSRFKTWPDTVTAQADRSWGYTTNLCAIACNANTVDGCPELVTRPIGGHHICQYGHFEFEVLGAVETARGATVADNSAFAQRLLSAMSVAHLRQRLQEVAFWKPS